MQFEKGIVNLNLELSIQSWPHDDVVYYASQFSDAYGERFFRVKFRNNGMLISFTDEPVEREYEWEISGEAADEFARLVSEASVAVCPQYVSGLDGTTITFKLSNGMNRVEFSWWISLPEQWGELAGVLEFLQTRRLDSQDNQGE